MPVSEYDQTRFLFIIDEGCVSYDELLEGKAIEVAKRLEAQIYVIGLRRLGYQNVEIAQELTNSGIPTGNDAISRWFYGKQTRKPERVLALSQLYHEAAKRSHQPKSKL